MFKYWTSQNVPSADVRLATKYGYDHETKTWKDQPPQNKGGDDDAIAMQGGMEPPAPSILNRNTTSAWSSNPGSINLSNRQTSCSSSGSADSANLSKLSSALLNGVHIQEPPPSAPSSLFRHTTKAGVFANTTVSNNNLSSDQLQPSPRFPPNSPLSLPFLRNLPVIPLPEPDYENKYTTVDKDGNVSSEEEVEDEVFSAWVLWRLEFVGLAGCCC